MPTLPICTITGDVYSVNGGLGAMSCLIQSVTVAGEIVDQYKRESQSANGVLTLILPRSSVALIQLYNSGSSQVVAQYTIAVPNSPTANLEDLITVASVPTSGIVVQEDGVSLANKAGTLNFGNGLVATEPSAGVALVALPYKVYRALLSQAGTDAPIATVLENSLGGTVVWARSEAGIYTATLASAFTANKTLAFTGSSWLGEFGVLQTARISTSVIQLNSLHNGAPLDGMLFGTEISILVYP